jgi:hypothetical protein
MQLEMQAKQSLSPEVVCHNTQCQVHVVLSLTHLAEHDDALVMHPLDDVITDGGLA